MPTPTDPDWHYIEAATTAIKDATPLRELYIALYDTEPDRQALQQFRNRLNANRSNPGAGMLGRCLAQLPQLHDMTVKEFFGLDQTGD